MQYLKINKALFQIQYLYCCGYLSDGLVTHFSLKPMKHQQNQLWAV